MLLASRLITAAATVGTGLVLAWLVQNIFYDKRFAALAYLTTDALFYHGWLAYSDPLFAFGVFVAIACLLVSCERQSFWLLIVAMLALTAAFLTKALTAYVFYLSAFVVLLFLGKRKFLMHPVSIVLHLIGLSAPLLWSFITSNVNGSSLIRDIWYWGWRAGQNTQITTYLVQLIVFPFEIFIRILPVSLVAVYYFWQGYRKPEEKHKNIINFLLVFIAIGFFPYWITTKHSARYVLPLYPFLALGCSYIVWQTNIRAMRIALVWFIVAIVIKYFSVIFWWPYYQAYYRGDYVRVAQSVALQTLNYPLYAYDPGATEHCVFDNVNILRYPLTPVKSISLRPPTEKDYFVFNTDNSFSFGKTLFVML
jgi:4-amino-4-deoxy-L-arabinose transferase-like glycosyltransferase